jgi:hypothetical protein
MTINRYRYFYACTFDMYGDHLFAFVYRMAELDHAGSTVKLYLMHKGCRQGDGN